MASARMPGEVKRRPGGREEDDQRDYRAPHD
jgi:hypothetical protein